MWNPWWRACALTMWTSKAPNRRLLPWPIIWKLSLSFYRLSWSQNVSVLCLQRWVPMEIMHSNDPNLVGLLFYTEFKNVVWILMLGSNPCSYPSSKHQRQRLEVQRRRGNMKFKNHQIVPCCNLYIGLPASWTKPVSEPCSLAIHTIFTFKSFFLLQNKKMWFYFMFWLNVLNGVSLWSMYLNLL